MTKFHYEYALVALLGGFIGGIARPYFEALAQGLVLLTGIVTHLITQIACQ